MVRSRSGILRVEEHGQRSSCVGPELSASRLQTLLVAAKSSRRVAEGASDIVLIGVSRFERVTWRRLPRRDLGWSNEKDMPWTKINR